MAVIVNNGYGDRHRWRQMNNIKGLLILAIAFFVAGIVMSIMTGIPAIGGSICTTSIILGVLGFFLLWKYKYSSVTVLSVGGGQTSTTVTSSAMMTHSYQQQQAVRSSSHSHSFVNMRQSSTNVQRSSSVAHIQDAGVLGWGGTQPSAPVDNGWMSNGSQTLDVYRQHPPPPPPPPHHAAQPGMTSQPGGYNQPGGYTQQPYSTQPGITPQPGGYTQPGGFTNHAGHPSSSTAGGFTNPAGPSSGLGPGPGPSLYSDAPPPSYDDAVRLQGKP